VTLGRREFRVLDCQLVVLMGIKFWKLIDAIQNIGDQLFEEDPRGYADLAA
jgi:hypothetical protein